MRRVTTQGRERRKCPAPDRTRLGCSPGWRDWRQPGDKNRQAIDADGWSLGISHGAGDITPGDTIKSFVSWQATMSMHRASVPR